MTTDSGAQPGWYPVDQMTERWWDGTSWGPQVRPRHYAGPPAAGQPQQSVTYQPRDTNHTFHLLMTLLTCGLWGVFVWLPMTIINSMSRRKVVTRYR